MNKTIEIPLSKRKLWFGLIGCLLAVAVSVWTFISANEIQGDSAHFLKHPALIKGVAIIGSLFFGVFCIYGILKVFDRKMGLSINSNGITDYSHALSVGLIKWEDIVNIRQKKMMSTTFILIDVVNPNVYINKSKNFALSQMMRSNMKMYGTPLSISTNTLQCNHNELEGHIISAFKKHKTGLSK